MKMAEAVASLAAQIDNMTPESRAELEKELKKAGALDEFSVWRPQPGPQIEAYFCEADIMLYGGAAGGGKTSLMVGTALNRHKRVAIFRQQVGELQGLMDEMDRVLLQSGHKAVSRQNNVWRGPNGKLVEFGHLERPNSELSWQGREHDLKEVDEASQVAPAKILYIASWLRSPDPHQKKQLILASNPPINGVGVYLIEWFAPWIDPTHELYPTAPGDLRWAYFEGEGDNITSVWVDEPSKKELKYLNDRLEAAMKAGDMETVRNLRIPKSRTFIPAKLSDNKYLGPEYMAEISSKPEPLRTALLTGDFFAAAIDDAMQVIPAAWVDLAVTRWRERWKPSLKMDCLGCDIAQGGADNHVMAPLHEDLCFGEITVTPGREVPDGRVSVNLIIGKRRDGASIVVDMTGGWGGTTTERLEDDHEIDAIPYVASEKSTATTRDGSLYFYNERAADWWAFREALDPDNNSPDEMPALPPDPALKRELTMPRWQMRSGAKILIESKDDIRDRLGRSTDRADGVIMAWKHRHMKAMRAHNLAENRQQTRPFRDPLSNYGPAQKQTQARAFRNPLR